MNVCTHVGISEKSVDPKSQRNINKRKLKRQTIEFGMRFFHYKWYTGLLGFLELIFALNFFFTNDI